MLRSCVVERFDCVVDCEVGPKAVATQVEGKGPEAVVTHEFDELFGRVAGQPQQGGIHLCEDRQFRGVQEVPQAAQGFGEKVSGTVVFLTA